MCNVLYYANYSVFYAKRAVESKPAVWSVVRPLQYAPPPTSSDLNSHAEFSAWRSRRMSVTRFIVLHPYTEFEVRKPSHSEDLADFRSRR